MIPYAQKMTLNQQHSNIQLIEPGTGERSQLLPILSDLFSRYRGSKVARPDKTRQIRPWNKIHWFMTQVKQAVQLSFCKCRSSKKGKRARKG